MSATGAARNGRTTSATSSGTSFTRSWPASKRCPVTSWAMSRIWDSLRSPMKAEPPSTRTSLRGPPVLFGVDEHRPVDREHRADGQVPGWRCGRLPGGDGQKHMGNSARLRMSRMSCRLRPRDTSGHGRAARRKRRTTMEYHMAIQRMDHVGIIVDDLAAATEFFVELGLELPGEGLVEGRWVDRVVGLDGVRAEIAVVQTPDGHGRLELTKFHTRRTRAATGTHRRTPRASARARSPSRTSTPSSPACEPAARNSWASWSATRTAIGSAASAVRRGSSSNWRSRSADGPARPTCDQPERSDSRSARGSSCGRPVWRPAATAGLLEPAVGDDESPSPHQ